MKIITTRLKFKTEKQLHIKDITSDAENFVEEGNIQNGVLVVFSLHTSATLTINEKESCFFKDFEDFVEKFASSKDYYRHNDLKIRTENLVCSPDTEECMNGHSHIQHMFIGYPSVTLIIENGKIVLGQWQRIFFLELDQPRNREVLFQIMGE